MRTLYVVWLKELRENLRDRRTLMSALLFGPLGAPLLFAAAINVSLDRSVERADQHIAIAVAGRERAPNLVAFLERQGVDVKDFAGDASAAVEAVRRRQARAVIVVPERFGAALARGEPAPLALYADSSDTSTAAERARVQALLQAYGSQMAALRLQARGISPELLRPLAVDSVDVATPAGRALLVLGMLSYFIVFATLMGGLYVAIDATAGERERGSLEPLLTLPVERSRLVYGKILAAFTLMCVSLALTLTAFTVSLRFISLERLGMSANFGVDVAATVFALMVPFALLGAGVMTLVASFTRSYREAQSWLTAVLLVPTLPIMFAAIYQVPNSGALMWIPSLSQHLLMNSLLRIEPLNPLHVAASAGASLAFAAVVAWVAGRMYRREAILG